MQVCVVVDNVLALSCFVFKATCVTVDAASWHLHKALVAICVACACIDASCVTEVVAISIGMFGFAGNRLVAHWTALL